MRNASNFVTVGVSAADPDCNGLLFGPRDHADGTIDDRLAGEAIVVRLVFEAFDLDRGAGGEIFQAFDHFDDAGAALAEAAAVHHLAHQGVEVDVVFDGLDAQVGPPGGHDFLAFIHKLNVGARDECGGWLRVHKNL
jgi:hypothetical protein